MNSAIRRTGHVAALLERRVGRDQRPRAEHDRADARERAQTQLTPIGLSVPWRMSVIRPRPRRRSCCGRRLEAGRRLPDAAVAGPSRAIDAGDEAARGDRPSAHARQRVARAQLREVERAVRARWDDRLPASTMVVDQRQRALLSVGGGVARRIDDDERPLAFGERQRRHSRSRCRPPRREQQVEDRDLVERLDSASNTVAEVAALKVEAKPAGRVAASGLVAAVNAAGNGGPRGPRR